VIATTRAHFDRFRGLAGVGSRAIVEQAAVREPELRHGPVRRRVHRWNQAQQDALLPHVESAT
jgi:hypothetical protein